MRVIFDTNIWISFLIGKKLSKLKDLLNNPNIQVWSSAVLEREFLDVAHRSKIRKYVNEKRINRIHKLMKNCEHCEITKREIVSVRDIKDLFLLELANEIEADFLVTGDNDLLCLEQHHKTKIITFETAMALTVF